MKKLLKVLEKALQQSEPEELARAFNAIDNAIVASPKKKAEAAPALPMAVQALGHASREVRLAACCTI